MIDDAATLEEAVPQADLVYLSQPVHNILSTIPRLAGLLREGALATDAGSTKRAIVGTANRHLGANRFLGGHPMAGKEMRGVEAAEAALFEGRTYILTPTAGEDLAAEPFRGLAEWLGRIGSRVVAMTPEEHDRTVAATSHLPQLLSTCLAAELAGRLSTPEQLAAAGPGLLSMTRLARSSFEIWDDILATNGDEIEAHLEAFLERLRTVRKLLRENPAALDDEFRRGSELSNRLRGGEIEP